MVRRVRVTASDVAQGDGGNTLPKVKWLGVTSEIPETTILRVSVVLDKPASDVVQVPFRLSGAAVYQQDFQFRSGPDATDPLYDRPVVIVAVGQTSGSIYVEGLPVTSDKSFTMTLALSSGVWSDGSTYDLQNATLDTVDLAHTITIKDSSTLTVSFQVDKGTVNETDATVPYTLTIELSAASPGSVSVDIDQTGGTAVSGTDFTPPAAMPLTVTFAVGVPSRVLTFNILDTPTTGVDETLVLGLSSYVNCSAGGITSHTLTIVDDEDPGPSGAAGFVDPTDVSIQEGNSLSVPITFSGGVDHSGISIGYTHAGSASGPSSVAAGPNEYRVMSPNPVYIQPGSDTTDILVQLDQDDAVTGPRDVLLTLTTITAGVAFGTKTKYVTLEDDDTDPPGGGADGSLLDDDGVRLAAERRQFDAQNPHMWVHPEGTIFSSSEGIEVPADIKDSTGATLLAKGSYPVPPSGGNIGSGISLAMRWAEKVWMALHGPNGTVSVNANSGAVAVGTELDEVLIGLKLSPLYDATRDYDYYVFIGGYGRPVGVAQNVSSGDLFFNGGSNSIDWGSELAANTCIRDLIVYTDQASYRTASIPRPNYQVPSATGAPVDNLRWERITFRSNSSSFYKIFLNYITGMQPHGRHKLYECQRGIPYDDDWNPGDTAPKHQYTMRCGPAAWDMRHRTDCPWPPFYSGWQHACFYLTSIVGTRTYAGLDGGAGLASNVFVNQWHSERLAPNHPSATFDGSKYKGPFFGKQANSAFQLVNRPQYNVSADMSSGLAAFIRCESRGLSHDQSSPGTAFQIYGHADHIVFQDCRVLGSEVNGKCGGGLKLQQDFSGNDGLGPQGRWSLQLDGAGRTYASSKVTIAGLILAGDNQGKTGISVYGVRILDLRSFRFGNWNGKQLQLGNVFLQPGDGFIKELRVDKLKPVGSTTVHNASFSSYVGWTTGTKLWDAYHSNWWSRRSSGLDNLRALLDADVDNLPTHGPASYSQSNGIIQQQYDNRLVATWGAAGSPGTGEVDGAQGSPTWTSAYAGSLRWPVVADVEIVGAATRYVGEDDPEGVNVDFNAPVQSKLRVYWNFADSAGAAALAKADQVAWPNSVTWTTLVTEAATSGSGQVTILPVGGQVGTGLNSDAQVGQQMPIDELWDTYYEHMWFRITPKTGMSTGTKTTTLTLDDSGSVGSGNQPDFETYPGSGTWEDTAHPNLQRVLVKIVPAVDYATVEFLASGAGITDLVAGANIPVQRASSGNVDAIQLLSTVDVEVASQPVGASFSFTPSFSWSAGDTGNKTFSISNIQGVADGDQIVLGFTAGSYGNAKAGGTVLVTFDIQTGGGPVDKPVPTNTGPRSLLFDQGSATFDDSNVVDGMVVQKTRFTGTVTVATLKLLFFVDCQFDAAGGNEALVIDWVGSTKFATQTEFHYCDFRNADNNLITGGGARRFFRCRWHHATTADYIHFNPWVAGGEPKILFEECYFAPDVRTDPNSTGHADLMQIRRGRGGVEFRFCNFDWQANLWTDGTSNPLNPVFGTPGYRGRPDKLFQVQADLGSPSDVGLILVVSCWIPGGGNTMFAMNNETNGTLAGIRFESCQWGAAFALNPFNQSVGVRTSDGQNVWLASGTKDYQGYDIENFITTSTPWPNSTLNVGDARPWANPPGVGEPEDEII